MRCSKCQYISFDNSDRCRNCGYEFSLAADADPLDLPIRSGDEPSGPLSDFSLSDLDAPPSSQLPAPSVHTPHAPDPPRRAQANQASRPPASGELPLFRGRLRDDDAPLVNLPASPRAPVAVRKSAAARNQVQRPVSGELDLDLDATHEEAPRSSNAPRTGAEDSPRPIEQADAAGAAPILPRLLAAAVDLALLAAIDLVVLYFTLKLCGLGFGDVMLIPVIPFGAFIALLNGGYVAAFTAAGGQTIGKMLAGIKVVTSEDGAWTDRVPVGAAALRAVGYLISALPAGLGFLPVLVGGERRGLHDRLAHTRVVKA